jgi:carbon storage regulator
MRVASQADPVEGGLMLVISRKLNEKLRIGDNVEVTVLEISGSRVVLGIDAPREIAIRRVGPASAMPEDGAPTELAASPSPPLTADECSSVPVAPLPFEYPTRAVPESLERRVKAPVVTVRRSRKITLPVDGETG